MTPVGAQHITEVSNLHLFFNFCPVVTLYPKSINKFKESLLKRLNFNSWFVFFCVRLLAKQATKIFNKCSLLSFDFFFFCCVGNWNLVQLLLGSESPVNIRKHLQLVMLCKHAAAVCVGAPPWIIFPSAGVLAEHVVAFGPCGPNSQTRSAGDVNQLVGSWINFRNESFLCRFVEKWMPALETSHFTSH